LKKKNFFVGWGGGGDSCFVGCGLVVVMRGEVAPPCVGWGGGGGGGQICWF